MQLSIWTWAKIRVLRSVVTATIATGAFQSFLLDLTVVTPGFLKRYVKESIRYVCVAGGGRICMYTKLSGKTLSNPRNMSLFSTVFRKTDLKNINPILQSPIIEHMLWTRHNAIRDTKTIKTHFVTSKAQRPKSGTRLSI